MDAAVTIKGVRKTFGPKVAVDDLDLVVPRGVVCGFIGPNGAGKTTTIRMIMSILFPDQGEIGVLGKGSAMESRDLIGYLPEERGLYRKMKVGVFLGYIARLKGLDGATADRKTKQWLERVGLPDSAKKKCEELSKGMQQKVQFIASVIHEPELIILDEVFSGLDPVNRRLMRELIEEQHGAGRTIIFSTHAMFEAEQLCEQVFMIHNGRKMLDGSLREITAKFDPRSLIVEPMTTSDVTQLYKLPGVARVSAGSQRGSSQGVVEVMINDGHQPNRVMSEIVSAIDVRRIEVKRVTLEDVFLEVVRRAGGGDIDPALLSRASSGSSESGGES
ncbi:MAG: ATP-binding cassette domain-containing protein [Phycisphaerales bacterium]|nr:ATP-binding cassette domain-containing protein [Phycisphaerales bacterium]